jgi:group I intron endonuclease
MLGFRDTEESKAKTAAAQLGKKLSEEHKANISKGMKGRVYSRSKKTICTDETRAKMSKTRQDFSVTPPQGGGLEKRLKLAEKLALAARRKNNSEANSSIVEVTNKETGEIVSYVSVRAAARALGISHATILKYIKLGKVFKQIYYFNSRSTP